MSKKLIKQLEDLALQMGNVGNEMLKHESRKVKKHGNELWRASYMVETWINGMRELKENV